MRWIFHLLIFFLFSFSYGVSVLNVKSWGGGVEYDMIKRSAKRTRNTFVFGSDFGHWFRVFDGTFECFDD